MLNIAELLLSPQIKDFNMSCLRKGPHVTRFLSVECILIGQIMYKIHKTIQNLIIIWFVITTITLNEF